MQAGGDSVQRLGFVGRDQDEVEDIFTQMYVTNRPRFRRLPAGSAIRASSAVSSDLAVGHVMSSLVSYSIDLDPFDSLMALVIDRGGFRTSAGGGEVVVGPGDGLCQPIGVAQHNCVADAHTRSVTLPMDRVRQCADELVGTVDEPFWLQGGLPVSPAAGRYWRTVVGLAHGALMDPASLVAGSALLREQLAQLVATAALSTFPNSTMGHDHAAGDVHVAPATIRRAADYMEANVGRPVSVAEVAQETRIGVRALQQGFRRYYGTTPTGYLRRARLEEVHRELLAADPTRGDTVRDIAARWGWAPSSKFTHAYRAAFGELPSDTLRR